MARSTTADAHTRTSRPESLRCAHEVVARTPARPSASNGWKDALLPSAVRGTMSVVAPNAQHLSPAVGLALSAGGAQLIANLYELEPRVPMATGTRGFSADGVPVTFQGSPSGALCRDIFHRNHPEEPLRPTSNRSLPAAHLSASLVADTLGLAWRRPGKSEVRDVLKRATCSETGLQVPALARETGVSIARFERLIDQVILADDDPHAPLPYMGTSLLLRHLWLRSSSRRELWTYCLHST